MIISRLRNYVLSHEARSTAGTAALMVFRKISSSAIAFILAPMLGAEEYGVYAFGIACLGIASVMVLAGFDRLAIREVAQLSERGEFSELRGFVQVATVTVLVISIGTALAGYIGLPYLNSLISSNMHKAVQITLLILPFAAFTLIAAAILIGFHRIVLGQVPLNIIQPVIFITLCFGYYAGHLRLQDGAHALVLYGIAAVAAFAFAAAGVFRSLPNDIWTLKPVYRPGTWGHSAMLMFLIASLQVIQLNGTPLIVGFLAGASTTGIFSLTFAVAQLVSFVHFAVDRPLSPIVAQLLARDQRQDLQKVITRLARLALLFALPVAAILILYGKLVLGIFGTEFISGFAALSIMVIAQLITIAVGQPGIVLMMAGYEKDVIVAMSARTVLLVALNIALVPVFGLIGAALAVSLSSTSANLLLFYRVYWRLNLNTTVF